MRFGWVWVVLVAGCRFDLPAVFNCTESGQCNFQGAGRCEPNGLCSYADANCASGLIANGGGGGEGSGNGANGNPGADPTSVTPAAGGIGGGGGNGGSGGAGGTGGGMANGGNGSNAPADGGGGGGGGTGVIKVYRGTLNGDHSPMPMP